MIEPTDRRRSNGGKRANAGRRATDLRSLSISDIGVSFDQPVEYASEVIVTQCGSCGAIQWEPYSVVVTATDPLPEPDNDGFLYPVLATVAMPGRKAKHRRGCPNKE